VSRPDQEFDTWDAMRARTWDLPGVVTLADLIGTLGGDGLPKDVQLDLLREFRDSSAWVPAPGSIKDAVQQALQ
jgi:hypothetical protein